MYKTGTLSHLLPWREALLNVWISSGLKSNSFPKGKSIQLKITGLTMIWTDIKTLTVTPELFTFLP